MRKHSHRWKRTAWSQRLIWEECRCGERWERPATPAEIKQNKKEQALSWKKSEFLHRLFHKILKKFGDGEHFTMKGWDLMQAMRKFAKGHPEIQHAGVDDSSFSGSDIWLIPHYIDSKKFGREYMGTTLLYIPQCSGEAPIEMFMYPAHLEGVLKALKAAQKFGKSFKRKSTP